MTTIFKCQMTVSWNTFSVDSNNNKFPVFESYGKCGKPAKFKNPKPDMGVEFVCGIHARSINQFYKRTNQNLQCIPLK